MQATAPAARRVARLQQVKALLGLHRVDGGVFCRMPAVSAILRSLAPVCLSLCVTSRCPTSACLSVPLPATRTPSLARGGPSLPRSRTWSSLAPTWMSCG
jgi:hypothetical protein